MSEGIKTVGVLGLRVMGFDIALLYAQRGCRTSVPMVYAVIALRLREAGASIESVDGVANALRAMADQGQSFYKEGQPNPWVAAFVDRRSHARH